MPVNYHHQNNANLKSMKLNKILSLQSLFLLGTVFLISCAEQSDTVLRENFQNPPLKYRMNQNLHGFPMDEAGQDSLINAYLDNGYGGFTINVPYQHYLTEEGMQATLSFCEKAKAAGMELWLYDEQGYPSGNAGDRVISKNPAWESMGLFFNDTNPEMTMDQAYKKAILLNDELVVQ